MSLHADIPAACARALAAAALLLPPAAARAQMIAVDVQPRHGAYVVGEPVIVSLKIENHGARPVIIDDHEAFSGNEVTFDIRLDPPDPLVPLAKLREGRIVEELHLERGESRTLTVDLSAWYPLLREGRYYLSAVLEFQERLYSSPKRVFDVVPGIPLAGVTELLPGTPPVERRFDLVYWARERGETAFLRITDQPGDIVWTTLNLGPVLRATTPRMSIDAEGILTIVHQATRDAFVISTVRVNGKGPELLGQRQQVDTRRAAFLEALAEASEESAAAPAERKGKRQPARKPAKQPAKQPAAGR